MDMSLFVPISDAGRVETVAQRIGDAITLGLLQDGDQLPSETELSEHLGVATVTLREALARLRQQGLVETRRGRNGGSFVRRPSTIATSGLVKKLRSMSTAELRDIGDEHLAVASTCARLAAERANAADIDRLRDHAEALVRARTAVERGRADSRFHVEIAVVSQSQRLTRREVELQAETSKLLWLSKPVPMDVDTAIECHHQLVEAIAGDDADRARRLAEEHILWHTHRLVDLHLRLTEE